MEIRICNTMHLMAMCRMAEKYQFNRQVVTEILANEIDPEGAHLLQVVLPYHQRSFGPSKEPVWPDHHRCQVYCKVNGTNDPAQFFLDVAVSDWEKMMLAEDFIAKIDDPVEAGIADARASANEEEYG